MSPEPEAPPPPPAPRPILIIRRKKGGHGGHHGGAWKVAYADFVTAMMALFIVLWLMSADKEVQQAVSAYFNNPTGPGKMTGTNAAGIGNALEVPRDDMARLAEKIQQALLKVPNFRALKDHVEITITSDGLRIELLETEAGMFFESGKPAPTESGSALLAQLASELGKLPNSLLIEGHTDSRPFSKDGYSNWELSADRANQARKLMQANGVRTGQVGQVRGYADRQLRHPEDPGAASNRRVSVIVQYLPPAGDAKDNPGEAESKKGPEEAGKPGESAKPTEAPKPAPSKEPAKESPPKDQPKPPVSRPEPPKPPPAKHAP